MAVVRELYGCCTSGTRLSPDADGEHHPVDFTGAVVRFVREKKTIPAPVGVYTMHGASPLRGPDALTASTPRSRRALVPAQHSNHISVSDSIAPPSASARRMPRDTMSHLGHRASAAANAVEGA